MAVEVTWAEQSGRVGAIVQHFYSGVLGGEALADVLFGLASPSGKLPVMVPTDESQLSADYLDQNMQAGQGRTHRYFKVTPLYSFGYGLGYSTFKFSDLKVSHNVVSAGVAASDAEAKISVSVAVTNNGEFAGNSDVVVTVYAKPYPRLDLA